MFEVRVWPQAAIVAGGLVEKYTDYMFDSEDAAIAFANKKKAEGCKAGWREMK